MWVVETSYDQSNKVFVVIGQESERNSDVSLKHAEDRSSL